jgi:choline dehydrogenase-like flavoprotein
MKFETVSMPVELIAARMFGLGFELVRQLVVYDHLAVWGVQVRARAHGSVSSGPFGGTNIRYEMLPEDVQVLKRGVRTLGELMFEAGAHTVYPGVYGLPEQIHDPEPLAQLDELDDDPARYHCIVAHLFGTAVLGPSGTNSVVNPELEAHDAPGLYVADSSVFPTNLGVNPQHTISAVAFILAEQLTEVVRRRRRRARQNSAPASEEPRLPLG